MNSGNVMWFILFCLLVYIGALDVQRGVLHEGRVLMCKGVVTKYNVPYEGEYTIVKGILYCKHPLAESYNKFKLGE